MGTTRTTLDNTLNAVKDILTAQVPALKKIYIELRDVISEYPACCISVSDFRTEVIATGKELVSMTFDIRTYTSRMEEGEKLCRQLSADIVDILKANATFNNTVYDNGYVTGYTVSITRAGADVPFEGIIGFTCSKRNDKV